VPIVQKHVLPVSIIYSDQWKSYETLSSLPERYKHYTVNHSKEFLDKRTGCHTNSVESIWLKCKSKIRSMNGVNRLYLQEYLDEVMWRHNECRIANKNPKKELRNSRKVAFAKMIRLLSVNNVEKLVNRIEFVEQEIAISKQKHKEQKHRKFFNSNEFVIRLQNEKKKGSY